SELVKKVAHVGVEGLGADDKARLPQLVLDDAQHRAWFDRVMASMDEEGDGHGHAHGHGEAADPHAADAQTAASPMPPADAVYAAQVVWDESMADAAARWLAHGQRIVILAGDGHCHDSAIVRRLQRRGVAPVVSVRPVVDDGHGNVAAALAEGINDYLFVMTPPAGR
ncbi:MAG TPA: ChaN family lipoprotein, partial [Kofleriaceae bacterium]|nr:ChaN family lipoprotein [Kofleriaceae bacterium]